MSENNFPVIEAVHLRQREIEWKPCATTTSDIARL